MTTIDRALHSGFVRHVFDLAAERFDQLHFLDRKAARDAENNTVTARNSHQREADSGVSGGRLDDGRARFEQTFFFGVENHAQRRAIFHRSAGIQPFDLCVNISEWWLCKSRKMKKGSLAYEIENAFCDAETSRW